MHLIIDREKDYRRACKGFTINGIRYRRLLGTPGGIKNSTIVFISERHIDEIRRRIDNGRDLNQALIPAKLEAYMALSCSASIPVSMPHGILVVKDCETMFRENVIRLNDEGFEEPEMKLCENELITLDATDGCGMMLPSLAERWSKELDLDYVVSGVNTRLAYEKGMVLAFDFQAFAEEVAGSYYVTDVWGTVRDIREIELVLTESMLKLWNAYPNLEAYLENCENNNYSLSITKTSPKELENERNLNYQFIQPYAWLTEEDIEELIAPTVQELKDVLGGDWAKTVLFLRGASVGETQPENMTDDIAKAIMADSRVLDDPYIRGRVYQLIQKRIDEAKIGVLKVHGNYSIVSGDLYALCQSMFGLPVTGLLKAGSIYNEYWRDSGAEQLAIFRAPMSCMNNIRIMRPDRSEETSYWFRYIHTCTILNAWDTTTAALNGMDYDGDIIMITDNSVLVNCHKFEEAVLCAQRKAEKKVPTEEDMIRSNLSSFGNEIGQTTNWVTSMYEVQARNGKTKKERDVLDYRIRCGQLFQQNVIDKMKGIVAMPMPLNWHDRHAVNKMTDEKQQRFYRSIVADKKPYFMRYIYPDLQKQYQQYIKNTERNALREFGKTVDELMAIPYSTLSDREKEFLRYYELFMPVGTGNCVMNKICRRFEEAFDGFLGSVSDSQDFDYTIYKSGTPYTQRQYLAIKALFGEYNNRLKNFKVLVSSNSVDKDEQAERIDHMQSEFRRECYEQCSNEKALCDIVLDICYSKATTKKFAWDMCANIIIDNLNEKRDGLIRFPSRCEDGEITYCGERFTMLQTTLEGSESALS
jgi:hypothetical protein